MSTILNVAVAFGADRWSVGMEGTIFNASDNNPCLSGLSMPNLSNTLSLRPFV